MASIQSLSWHKLTNNIRDHEHTGSSQVRWTQTPLPVSQSNDLGPVPSTWQGESRPPHSPAAPNREPGCRETSVSSPGFIYCPAHQGHSQCLCCWETRDHGDADTRIGERGEPEGEECGGWVALIFILYWKLSVSTADSRRRPSDLWYLYMLIWSMNSLCLLLTLHWTTFIYYSDIVIYFHFIFRHVSYANWLILAIQSLTCWLLCTFLLFSLAKNLPFF